MERSRLRAIGYIRVSTEEQAAQGHSLAMQPERIRQWCELQDIELIDIVRDEGVSASRNLETRPGGAQLLRRLRNREADVLVVYRLDRLMRNAQDGLNFIRTDLHKYKVSLHSVSELLNTSTAVGRLCLTMMLAVAEYDRDLDCERTTSVIENLRQRGKVSGTVPYGCIAVGGRFSPQKNRMVGKELFRCPQKWPNRELIVSLRETLVDGEPMPYSAIVRELFTRGIPAPNGAPRWQKTSVSTVVNTHGGLKHIPPLPPQHEPAVSEAASA